jgi:FKBP-type peptidyl-prolyl cis-trans isomerase FklB
VVHSPRRKNLATFFLFKRKLFGVIDLLFKPKYYEDAIMNLKWIIVCSLFLTSSQAWSSEKTVLKTEKEKLSYSIGASIGKNFKMENTDIDLNLMMKGLKSSIAGEKSLLSDQEIRQVMGEYQQKLRQHAMLSKQQASVTNKKKGEEYLAEFKTQQGVLALPSGVLYKIIKEGNGKKPAEFDVVEVNYRGTLTSGKEFDATKPGEPASLKISSLIAGWKQALSMMPVGSKWQIVIPSEHGYGERGAGAEIGPNEVLVFDVELLAIK